MTQLRTATQAIHNHNGCKGPIEEEKAHSRIINADSRRKPTVAAIRPQNANLPRQTGKGKRCGADL